MRKLPRFATFVASLGLLLGALTTALLSSAANATTRHRTPTAHRVVATHRPRHPRHVAARRRHAVRAKTAATRRVHTTAAKRARRVVRITRPHLVRVRAVATPIGGVWSRLRMCEAGGDYQENTGNGYYGAYQFSLSTWRAIGESGMPNQASFAVQDAAAIRLQSRAGWTSWPHCAYALGLV